MADGLACLGTYRKWTWNYPRYCRVDINAYDTELPARLTSTYYSHRDMACSHSRSHQTTS